MNYNRIKKSFKKTLITTLTVTSLASVLAPGTSVFAQESEPQYLKITEENIEAMWDKFFDENYAHYEFNFTEEASEAFGRILVENAKAEVAMMTEEELAEIEQEMRETEEVHRNFWDNLTPESLWEQYVIENPEVLRMRNGEKEQIKAEVLDFYHELDSPVLYKGIESFSNGAVSSQVWMSGPLVWWKRQFSTDAGVGSVSFNAVHGEGTYAAGAAGLTALANFWGGMRQDAYRHWLWNARSVRNTVVGSTAAQRRDRTRIVTTYREIATYIHRFDNSLRISHPSAAQLQRGRNMRRDLLAMNENAWVANSGRGLDTPNGRHEQMDLWNNHWGRVDGQAGAPTVARFNTRWNSTVQNTGLVRGNGTAPTEMSLNRQRHLFRQGWHRPR